MAELRRQIQYKTAWTGGRVHIADRWFPSSTTCSSCGVVKAKLRLSDRTYQCEACGLVLDRDLNAARNLAALAAGVYRWLVLPELRGEAKRARWKPTSDPHHAGSGYRHGKTRPAGRVNPHRKVTATGTARTHVRAHSR
jgi:putative transposase